MCRLHTVLIFQHTSIKEARCIARLYSHPFLQPQESRRGLQTVTGSTHGRGGRGESEDEEAQEEDGKFYAVKKKKKKKQPWIEKVLTDTNFHNPQKDVEPRAIVASLKDCADRKDLEGGSRIHADIARTGLLLKDVFIGSTLVSMYIKCGSLTIAREVFNELPVRNTVSWNVLMAGYVQHACFEEALHCFVQMQLEGIFPDAVSFICIFKACGSSASIEKGQMMHAQAAVEGLLERDSMVGATLVDMYTKCCSLAKACELFDKLPGRDEVVWSSLIAGYAKQGQGKEALNCFGQMQLEGVSPNAVTYVCILKACGSMGAAPKGQQLHAQIVIIGNLERNVVVGTALMDMYAKCGSLSNAQQVFDQLRIQDVVAWSALVAGYSQKGSGEEALNCYELMQVKGIAPNTVTFVCALKACGMIGAINKGQEIHAEINKIGLLKTHMDVGIALVDMYAKCGWLVEAQAVFDMLPSRDLVTWNVLIAGYIQHECAEAAINSFEQMQVDGVTPNALTFTCILKACGISGAADRAQGLHSDVVREGFLKKDIYVGSALIDMYMKLGLLTKAQDVFDKLPERDVTCWSALITGYAQLGKADDVFYSFDKMRAEGIKPNLITFSSVLKACSHTGQLDKAQIYFESMNKDYGLIPTVEHLTCMVDLLVRAGLLDQAVAVIKKMPYSANLVLWLTVLGACQKWGNVELGRQAFEHALQLNEKDPVAYVCMSNIYSDAGREEDADCIEAMCEKNHGRRQVTA